MVEVALLVAAWVAAAALARVVGIWAAVGGAAVLLGGLLLATRRVTLARPRAVELAWGAAAGVAMSVATVVAGPLLTAIPGAREQLAALYLGFRALPPPLATLVLVPIVAGEELVWRGAVQRALAARLDDHRAVPVAAALYAAAHAPIGSWLLCAAAAGCGALWSALAARTRGLVAPFVAHLVWDVAVLFVAPLGS